jgi:hypothetical protein
MEATMKARNILLALIVLLACTGGKKWEAKVDAWQGRDFEELIMNWVPPDSMYTASDGSKLLRFSRDWVHQGIHRSCDITVKTDSQGIIRDSTVRGDYRACGPLVKTVPVPQ